jgi:methionyl-tRNA formyltransferase
MTSPCIVLATPHARFDALEKALRARGVDVLRIREREALTIDMLSKHAPRYVFFPHWSWRIPTEIHQKFECVIFHMTDVPFGRGGSPLQNLIIRGIENTRLTALRCVDEMDAGPVYLKRDLSTLGAAEEVFLRARGLMESMILEIFERQPQPVPQHGEVVTFTRRTPAEGNLEAAQSLSQLHDVVRMLDADGYPPAFLECGGWRMEFSRASLKDDCVIADVRIRRAKENT